MHDIWISDSCIENVLTRVGLIFNYLAHDLQHGVIEQVTICARKRRNTTCAPLCVEQLVMASFC